jgi:S1-C subfamily serine protease
MRYPRRESRVAKMYSLADYTQAFPKDRVAIMARGGRCEQVIVAIAALFARGFDRAIFAGEEVEMTLRSGSTSRSSAACDGAKAFAFRIICALVVIVALPLLLRTPALAADVSPPADEKSSSEKSSSANATAFDAERFFQAFVKVQTRAVPNARSSATLGSEREGTGIVIGDDGLVLTIGYLIVEADEVNLVDQQGRNLPARVIGYDHATGLGLVRSVVPFDVAPLRFGDSSTLAERDPVMIINYSGASDVTPAWVVSKRAFTGNWEYLLESAIFTSPPALNWSGAALISKDMRLVGIGSLIVREASTVGETVVPGNMFVPIDALKPILSDLVKTGRSAGAARPWLGVAADEVQGRLIVSRVSPDGPGDLAGIKVGDIILGVGGDGVRTQAEFYRKVWSRGPAGADIPLRVLQGLDVKELAIHSIDRVEYFRPKTTY